MTRPPTPDSVRQLALAHGIGPSTVTERLRRGWNLEAALTTPAERRHARRTGVAEAARKAGIGRSTVAKRIALGWTLDEALQTPVGRAPDRAKPAD